MEQPDPIWVQTHLPNGVKGVMKFTLVWNGNLPASGNKPKTRDVTDIRTKLSAQLAYLWETHNALQVLKEQGFIINRGSTHSIVDQSATPRELAQRFPRHMIDLCDWIQCGKYRYKPLVRKSLDLSCDIDILFLRQDDPGALITQGGDLDGRIKTLLDALRMPSLQEQDISPPDQTDIYCLMQSDTLISSLDIDTERLLFPESTHQHEVHLVIEVSLRVLRVNLCNYCLL